MATAGGASLWNESARTGSQGSAPQGEADIRLGITGGEAVTLVFHQIGYDGADKYTGHCSDARADQRMGSASARGR